MTKHVRLFAALLMTSFTILADSLPDSLPLGSAEKLRAYTLPQLKAASYALMTKDTDGAFEQQGLGIEYRLAGYTVEEATSLLLEMAVADAQLLPDSLKSRQFQTIINYTSDINGQYLMRLTTDWHFDQTTSDGKPTWTASASSTNGDIGFFGVAELRLPGVTNAVLTLTKPDYALVISLKDGASSQLRKEGDYLILRTKYATNGLGTLTLYGENGDAGLYSLSDGSRLSFPALAFSPQVVGKVSGQSSGISLVLKGTPNREIAVDASTDVTDTRSWHEIASATTDKDGRATIRDDILMERRYYRPRYK